MKAILISLITFLLLLAGCHPAPPVAASNSSGSSPSGSLTEVSDGQFVPGQFTLKDQDDKPVSIVSDSAPVTVVSFLFTHCTDTCPFLAVKLQLLSQELGPDAQKVRLILVSTDPERDTPKVLNKYTQEFGMQGKWNFLTGKMSAVQPVWSAFHVSVTKQVPDAKDDSATDDAGPSPEAGLTPDETSFGNQVAKHFGGGYDVVHTTSFFILDAKGSVRAIMGAETAPQDLKAEVLKIASQS